MKTATAAVLMALIAAPAFADEPPICTDRPSKANSVCTVPQGRWQIEAEAYNLTRTEAGGVTVEFASVANTTVKYGLDSRSDVEVSWSPFVERTARVGGVTNRASGAGDAYVRYKRRLSPDSAAVDVAVIPFLKLPTARRVFGNGAFEGGVALPVSFPAPGGFSVALGPEIDLLVDADGEGRHANLVNLVNVSRPVTDRLTVIGEVWSAMNFDPSGRTGQASADFALAWAVSGNAQLDAGANFGLTGDTPDWQIYFGASRRF